MIKARTILWLLVVTGVPLPAYAQCEGSDAAGQLSSAITGQRFTAERGGQSVDLGNGSCLTVRFGWSVGAELGRPEPPAPSAMGVGFPAPGGGPPAFGDGDFLASRDDYAQVAEVAQTFVVEGLALDTTWTPGSFTGGPGPQRFAVGGSTELAGSDSLRLGFLHAVERSLGPDGEQSERATGVSLGLGRFTAKVAKHELWGEAEGPGSAISGQLKTTLDSIESLPDEIELRAMRLKRSDGTEAWAGIQAGWFTDLGAFGFDVHMQQGDESNWGFGASWSTLSWQDGLIDLRAAAEVDGSAGDASLSFGGRVNF